MGAVQLEAAVDEVALDRLIAEEAERESWAAEEPLPDPERIPIEAPRAPRRTASDLSTSASPCTCLSARLQSPVHHMHMQHPEREGLRRVSALHTAGR